MSPQAVVGLHRVGELVFECATAAGRPDRRASADESQPGVAPAAEVILDRGSGETGPAAIRDAVQRRQVVTRFTCMIRSVEAAVGGLRSSHPQISAAWFGRRRHSTLLQPTAPRRWRITSRRHRRCCGSPSSSRQVLAAPSAYSAGHRDGLVVMHDHVRRDRRLIDLPRAVELRW